VRIFITRGYILVLTVGCRGAANFTNKVYSDVFNHLVAENGCKWYDTEPSRGVSNLTDCKAAQTFAFEHLASFRLHNTFWHQQTPSWLPGNVSADDLVKNIIPQHVQQEIGGMGRTYLLIHADFIGT
jgi:endo-1,4-beta-xylanase